MYSIYAKYLIIQFALFIPTAIFSQNLDWQSLDELWRILEHAQMSKHAYKENMSNAFFDAYEMPKFGRDTWGNIRKINQGYMNSGLYWSLYERRLSNGNVERTLAFAGTENLKRNTPNPNDIKISDWIPTNIQQGLSLGTPKQYKEGLKIAEHYAEEAYKTPNMSFTVTGHSKGGGIAQYVSINTGIRAYVYDSAPLAWYSRTFTKNWTASQTQKENLANTNIVSVFLKSDEYSKSDLVYSLPGKHFGRQYPLEPSPSTIESFKSERKNPKNELSIGERINLFHSVDNVVDALTWQTNNYHKPFTPPKTNHSSQIKSSIPIISIPDRSFDIKSNFNISQNLVPEIEKAVVVGSGNNSLQFTKSLERKLGINNIHAFEQNPSSRELQRYANQVGANAIFLLPQIELPRHKPPVRRNQDFYSDIQRNIPYTPPPPPPPSPPSGLTNRVGGVMLSNVAELKGSGIHSDNFTLIFENEDGIIEIEELRRFVTALWAVYFSEQVPGISIDPIAPDIDKHFVRYIGQVINLDIGRVMREADYKMKEWAVGTSKPEIKGFKSVDELSMIKGINYLGASRRFWFVPEDMQFQLMGDVLVFESGRMTLKTEYIGNANKAEPADLAFAKFFTENYDTIAVKHPIYDDLFDYAKLVSFARYLEEKNIPLLWFLLANKDLVITEDSPGTVDAFAKKSDYLEYVWIEGGVEMGNESKIGNYVYDEEALKAIQKSLSSHKINESKNNKSFYAKPVVLKSGERNLTYAPSKSLVIGSEQAKNEKYYTDIFHREGKQRNLELVRYYNPNYKGLPTIGNNWHLMIPYQIEPFGDGNIIWEGNLFPPKYLVKNLLTEKTDTLSFNDQRYSVAGYVPKDSLGSNLIGLFFLTDGSLRLADKIGVEYQFDNGLMSQMIVSENYFFEYDYGYEVIEAKSLEYQPYKIKPKDGQCNDN